MRINFRRIFILFSPILLSLLTSCGQNGGVKVTQLKVNEKIVQDQVWIDTLIQLDLGNITLPSLIGTIPIRLPKQGLVGELELGSDFVRASINLSQVLKLNPVDSLLPNGQKLPLISDNKVILIPVKVSANQSINLYLSLANGAKALGVTIPIADLDSLGKNTIKDPTSFFPAVLVGNVKVYPGIYTSPSVGKNGLGLFVDLKDVFYRLSSYGLWYEVGDDVETLEYAPLIPSKNKVKSIQRFIYGLDLDERKLSFE